MGKSLDKVGSVATMVGKVINLPKELEEIYREFESIKKDIGEAVDVYQENSVRSNYRHKDAVDKINILARRVYRLTEISKSDTRKVQNMEQEISLIKEVHERELEKVKEEGKREVDTLKQQQKQENERYERMIGDLRNDLNSLKNLIIGASLNGNGGKTPQK